MSRTIEEYKKDVFDNLDDNKKLEYMYQMNKQLCSIAEYTSLLREELKRYSSVFDEIPTVIIENRIITLQSKVGEL